MISQSWLLQRCWIYFYFARPIASIHLLVGWWMHALVTWNRYFNVMASVLVHARWTMSVTWLMRMLSTIHRCVYVRDSFWRLLWLFWSGIVNLIQLSSAFQQLRLLWITWGVGGHVCGLASFSQPVSCRELGNRLESLFLLAQCWKMCN
jgi:hypothetical protein